MKACTGDQISLKGQVNEFKAKVYENFFSAKNNSFVILIKCDEEIKNLNGYEFQRLNSNQVEKMGEILNDKITKFVDDCCRLAPTIRQKPS